MPSNLEVMMSTQRNKERVRVFIETVWNDGRTDRLEEFLGSDYVLHDPVTGDLHGFETFREFVQAYRTAFPDLRLDIEDQIAEGDRVVSLWTSRDLCAGEIIGIVPPNRPARTSGVSIDRFDAGKILETWGMWDALDLIRELGLLAATEETF
jgi:steroid delta-isomerase-like uncharacterized protein